jgi:hypothetical protein
MAKRRDVVRKGSRKVWPLVTLLTALLVIVVVATLVLVRRTYLLYKHPCRTLNRCCGQGDVVHWRDLWRHAQNCDVVVQSSVRWWGSWSRYVLGSDFTHVGALWFNERREPFIAEVVLDTMTGKADATSHVQLQPLADALKNGYSLVVRTVAGLGGERGSRSRAPLDSVIEKYHTQRRVHISINGFRMALIFAADVFGKAWFKMFPSGCALERSVRRFDSDAESLCTDFLCEALRSYGAEPNYLTERESNYYILPSSFVCNSNLSIADSAHASAPIRLERTLRIVGD